MSNKFLLSFNMVVNKIARWLAWGSAGVVGFMMIMLTIDILGLKFFGLGFPSSREMTEDLNVLIFFLAVAYVQTDQGHIRISLIEDHVSKTGARILRAISYLLSFFVCGFLVWRTSVLLQGNLETRMAKTAVIPYPIWPMSLVMVIGCTLLTIVYILLFIKTLLPGTGKE